MDSLVQFIIGDVTEFNEMTFFVVIVKIIIFVISVETFGMVCGHLASVGK